MAILKNALKTLVLTGGLLVGGSNLKAQQKTQQYQDSVSQVLKAQQRQANILSSLKQKAVLDSKTEVSYVFDNLPADRETLAIAARNHIFFAEPGKLRVGGGKNVFIQLQQLGFSPKKIANDIYEITVGGNLEYKKEELTKKLSNAQVVYSYTAYTSACPTFNDPQTYPAMNQQLHISDAGWVNNGFQNPITVDLDSVYSKKVMHVQSTTANPNIVVNIFDGGFDVNNAEFQNRVIRRWNHTNNSINTTATNHGSSVASLSSATANNGFGGVGMYDGPIRLYQVSADGVSFPVANLYVALDSLIQHCLQYPNQRQINNFSLSAGNDPLILSRIQQLFNMNGGKQNFNQAATGNAGATSLDWPARRPECTARGATATSYLKPIRSSSNTGVDMLDHGYVSDGQNVWAMQANGTFAAVNGTSFSTPIGTGEVAVIVSQDTTRTNAQVRTVLDDGARDLGATGPDNIYGKGWVELDRGLKIQAVKQVPNSFDASVTPSYNFIPKYYNGLLTTNEKAYINGSSTPISPTINGLNEAVFALNFTITAGFVNGTNTIRYEFNTPDGCITSIYKTFTLSNVTTVTTPPTPNVIDVADKCQSEATKKGKLMNPPVGATITVTEDLNPLSYNAADSTFGPYFVSNSTTPGNHNIQVKYTNTAGTSQKDTAYNVTAAIATSISAPTASASAICIGQSSNMTAIFGNMGTNPTFQWYRNGNPISGATASTYNYTNAAVGTQGFHVVITRDPNGCYTTASPVSSTSPVTNVVVSPTPNAPIDNVVQPTCSVATGSITVTNGQAGDQFSFNNGVTWQTSNVATGLAAGTYQVLVKNSGGCISSATAEVINAAPGTPSAPIDNVVQPTCSVATGSITVTNGQAGDQYSFNNGASWQTSNVASGLPAGTYQVLRKNTAGCISAATAEVINAQPATPNAPVDNVVQPTCAVSTGTITVTNGQAGDQYSFNNGATWQTNNVATGLAAGTYQVLRKNTAGCISSATAEVINAQPATPSAPIDNVVQPTCAVSTGTITVTNGQAGDQFSFNNGVTWQTSNVATGLAAGTYQVLRKNTAGCISSATTEVITAAPGTPSAPVDNVVQPTCSVATGSITVTNGQAGDQYSFNNGVTWVTSNVATGLTAGTYQVLRKNTAGCISSATVEVINAQPATPSAPATSVVQPTCAISTGTITVTNGQAGDQYSFNNGVTWVTSNVATGLAAGTYQVLRKNTAGCISSATAQVINASPSTPNAPIDNVVQPTCAVATGSITVTNGQAGDQYSFNNGVTWVTSNVATGLAAGTYQVLRKNTAGCISSATAEVINAQPATPNAPATSVVQPTCAVSSGTITVTNGQAGDQFSFNNGTTWQTSNVASGLAAGTYQVLRKNTAGCISSATAEVITSAPNAPVVGAISQVNNTISVPTIAGATYQWQFSTSASGPFTVVAGATSASYTITQSGFYRVVATGTNGCTGQSNTFNALITGTNPNPNASNGDLRLFPNPIQNGQKLTIDSLPQLLTEVTIVIYDNTGRRVNGMVVPVANRKAQFQLPFLPSGLYMIRIQDKKNNKRYDGEKIIVN